MLTKSQISYLSSKKNICVACSGGVDSMVLCDVLLKLDIPYAIAHCNFQLRADDSKKDYELVKTYAEKNGLKFYSISFETRELSKVNKTSIEIEARNLRYHFFDSLIQDKNIDLFLLAHHIDDHIETLLMRMITGTGVKGMKGMAEFKPPIYYRPFLHISKPEIYQYAHLNNIEFRIDQSNFENDYLRNKIRNKIVPEIEEINPSYRESFQQISEIAKQTNSLLQYNFETLKNDWREQGVLNLENYKDYDFYPLIISYIFEENNINSTEINLISKSLPSKEKKLFDLDKCKIEVKNYCISRLETEAISSPIIYDSIEDIISDPYLTCEIVNKAPTSYENNVLYIDIAKIRFPLQRRSFREGDKIKRIGMKGKSKKISGLFQEKKWTSNQKNKACILEDIGGDIIGIIGIHIAESVRIDDTSSAPLNILKISI